jgi:hypothetical protein
MFKKAKLTSAVALVVLSLGAVSNASAHNMYNKFSAADSATDGWVYGFANLSDPTVTPGFTGTAVGATPFGYAGKGWVNWAAAIHHTGLTEISDANAGFDADLDTNKGSWNDNGQSFNPSQGWAHNTDIGLIKADHDMTLTLNITNVEGTWSNYGISIFEGMNTGGFDSHHEGWNVGWSSANEAAAQQNNPFGLVGLNYLAHDGSVDSINGLTFFAKAGQVYTVLLGGNEFGSVFGPTADYKLSINAVPVPGAVWLFGSALAGLGVFSRRKQHAG